MDILKFKEQVFVEGEKLGFSALEVYYEKSDSFSCNIYKGEIDKYESSTVNGVSVRGFYKGKMGYAYTEKLDEESITFLLTNAKENALLIEEEGEKLFTEKATYMEKDFYSPAIEDVTTEEKISFLKEVEKKILAYDKRVVQANHVSLRDEISEKALFHHDGLALQDRNNFLYVMFSVMVKDGEEVKSGFHFKVTKDFHTLNSDELAKETVEKALGFLGGKTYPNKNYPVILKNSAAAQLLATFTSAFSADAVQKGQSRLKDKIGEQIAASCVTLVDNPFLEDGMGSGTFDSEGVPTKKHAIVENGQLKTYFHNLKTAEKDGVQSTGHGYKPSYKGTIGVSPSNFFVEKSDESYESLYSELEEGVIITDLAGLHSGANQISGDFSLAAEGYFVKDGKIVGPTNQMTVAGNFFDLLKDVEKVGRDLEFSPMGGYIGSPSLKIKSLAVTVD